MRLLFYFCFFKQKTAYEMRISDWSSDVCSSDLKRDRLDRAREMLAMVGLAGFEDAFPNELSGGMRSRVALARSLAPRPRILLMDEPFSRLDTQTRTTMHGELVRLRDLLGMTVLFVTHDVEEAVVLADTVTVDRKG